MITSSKKRRLRRRTIRECAPKRLAGFSIRHLCRPVQHQLSTIIGRDLAPLVVLYWWKPDVPMNLHLCNLLRMPAGGRTCNWVWAHEDLDTWLWQCDGRVADWDNYCGLSERIRLVADGPILCDYYDAQNCMAFTTETKGTSLSDLVNVLELEFKFEYAARPPSGSTLVFTFRGFSSTCVPIVRVDAQLT